MLAKMIDKRGVETLKQFKAELPFMLKALATHYSGKHTGDIVKIAHRSAQMTAKVI